MANRRAKEADAGRAVPLRTATDYLLCRFKRPSPAVSYNDAAQNVESRGRTRTRFLSGPHRAGGLQDRLMKYSDAAAGFTTAVAGWPDVWWGYYHRGLVFLKQGNVPKAHADSTAPLLAPKRAEILIHPAIASQNLKDYPAAIRDLDRTLELGTSKVQAIALRAGVGELAGDKDAANRDLAEAMKLEPTDDITWVTRGLARLTSDPAGGLKDFDAALTKNPRPLSACKTRPTC